MKVKLVGNESVIVQHHEWYPGETRDIHPGVFEGLQKKYPGVFKAVGDRQPAASEKAEVSLQGGPDPAGQWQLEEQPAVESKVSPSPSPLPLGKAAHSGGEGTEGTEVTNVGDAGGPGKPAGKRGAGAKRRAKR